MSTPEATETVIAPSAALPHLASIDFLTHIPRDFARDHGLLSQGTVDGAEVLAITATTSGDAVWNVGVRLGRPVRTIVTDGEVLQRAIDDAYERAAAGSIGSVDDEGADGHAINPDVGEEDLERLLSDADRDLLTTAGKAPLVKLTDRLLFSAVQIGASDLHIQPTAEAVLIRHRVDGVLDQGRAIAQALFRPLVSRIKVMGRMDVAERLVPQDGRTTVRIGSRAIDVRISTIPTAYGERVVLRLLDSANQLFDVASLGMPAHIAIPFEQAARRSSGIVLVTGPTGSGKTTTLYATLRRLDAAERNIMTIEDPIEYELSSLGIPISQTQVNLKKGVNFANGLRHILRQDPDVIMVGEIRDAETARIAIQASLTGHLVFSTLHTNDAVSAVSRLIDLGVEPYLVAASLSAVLAQRLVRTRCCSCLGCGKREDQACVTCLGTGYKGRTGIFELLPVTEPLRAAITTGASPGELRASARTTGMRTLADEGEALIAAGRTTLVEVERVIHHG
jgi:general secretion pathway protein E